MNTPVRTALFGLALSLAACTSDGTTGFGTESLPNLDRDVATAAADAIAQDVELMGGPAGALGMGLLAGVAADAFPCGNHERRGLTVVRTCVFKDADGDVQAAYDPASTASIAIHVEIDGEVGHNQWSATVHRVRDLVVSGLAGDETTRTWNGSGSGTATRSRHTDSGETRTYDLSGALTVRDVVVAVPRTRDSWPLSGSVTKHVTIEIVGGPRDGTTHERTVTITFNGTRFVPIMINDKTFTFDLETRRVVR